MKIAITKLDKRSIDRKTLRNNIIHLFLEDISSFEDVCFLDSMSLVENEKVFFVFDKPVKIMERTIVCRDIIYDGYDLIY